METSIAPFSDLSPEERLRFKDDANWMVRFPNGEQRGDWLEVRDDVYRVAIQHILVRMGDKTFDKYNLLGWGAFVLPMRIDPAAYIAEFCIPKERRILLRNNNGIQGDQFVDNIPQGAIDPGESIKHAAIREAMEETGRRICDVLLIGRSAFDVANSESVQEFYLGLVKYDTQDGAQTLEATEDLSERWYTWKKLLERDILDCKTEAILFRAQRFLDPRLLLPEVYGQFILNSRFDLTQIESLERYIKPGEYQQLKQQTVDSFHPFDSES